MDRYVRCFENSRVVTLTIDSRPGVTDLKCPNYSAVTMMCDKLMPEDWQRYTVLADIISVALENKLANAVTRKVEGDAICHFRRDEFKRSLIVELIRELEVPPPESERYSNASRW